MILGSSMCTLKDLGNGNNPVTSSADRSTQSDVCTERENDLSTQKRSDFCRKREAPKVCSTLDPKCTDSLGSHIYSSINEHSASVDMGKKYLINKDLPGYISPPTADDDDSVSTLGSDEDSDHYSNGTARSIFRDYWDTGTKDVNEKEMSSSRSDRRHTGSSRNHDLILNDPVPRRISLDWSSYHQDYEDALAHKAVCDPHGYEDYLKMNEEGRTVMPSAALLNVAKNNSANHLMTRNELASPDDSTPSRSRPDAVRREIFSYKYASKGSTLPSYEYKSKSTSPAQPSPLHNRRMLRSSLRDRSSSVSESLPTVAESTLSQSTRLSVTFDTHVSIHEYSKPCESYIHDGWSKFFY